MASKHRSWDYADKDINDYDPSDWESLIDSARRTPDGVRYDYDRNHNGRMQRSDRKRW